MEVRRSKGVRIECKVGLQNGKPQQCRIIVRTRDLPPVALLLSQRAAEVAMVTDRRKPEPTLPFSWMQAPDVSLSCVKWFSCTVLQLLLLPLLLLFFFFFFSFLFFFPPVSSPPTLFAPLLKLARRHQSSSPLLFGSSSIINSFYKRNGREFRENGPRRDSSTISTVIFVCQRGTALTDITRIQGVEIFADSLEWLRRTGIEAKESFNLMYGILKHRYFGRWRDERNFRKLEKNYEEFSNSWNKHFVTSYTFS